jgi:polar amino acid transport system substrate-binding protein
VLAGDTDVFFGERAQLLDGVTRSPSAKDLLVLKRHFTYAPLALAIARNDDEFRTSVDRALNRIYASPEFGALYTATFGKPDPDTVEFFRQSAAPE